MSILRTAIVSLTVGIVVALVLLGNGKSGPAGVWGAPPTLPTPALTPNASEPAIPLDVLNASSEAFAQLIEQGLGGLQSAPVLNGAGDVESASQVAGSTGGVDVIVNDPNVFPATIQNETTLAVRGSTICAGYNDFRFGSGLSRSPDLGASWTDLGGIGQVGDPVLAVHQASGTFYYGEIAFFGGLRAIGVARSTDDCQSFPTLANASPNSTNATDAPDKPWIAVDNSGGPLDGTVYVCWTQLTDNITDIDLRFSRSIDGGVTFIDEQVISPPTQIFPFGCFLEVGANGEVYASWSSVTAIDTPVWFLRSLDGGLNWLGPAQVSSAPVRVPGADRLVSCDVLRPTLNGDIRMLPQTWMAADTTGGPFDGRIYAVWAHDPPGLIDNSDVFFSSSEDGGLTWAPQLQIAGGTETDQFEPFVEVGGQGTVSIVWYDRRNDPVNNFDIDVYTTFSTDGGASFQPISQLNDVSFPPIAPGCYMGEYIAIAADADNFYYAWGDNRNGDPDVFFDRVAVKPLALPTATPPSVGGVAVEPELAQRPLARADSSAASRNFVIAVALLFAAAFTGLGAATWHTRKP